jgi:hypothetical protein
VLLERLPLFWGGGFSHPCSSSNFRDFVVSELRDEKEIIDFFCRGVGTALALGAKAPGPEKPPPEALEQRSKASAAKATPHVK